MDKELFGNLLTSLGPTKGKFENFQEWFSQVVKGEMIKVNERSRCYILRPLAIPIWEIMQV
jgi:prolyl-tRNA synthetase